MLLIEITSLPQKHQSNQQSWLLTRKHQDFKWLFLKKQNYPLLIIAEHRQTNVLAGEGTDPSAQSVTDIFQ